MIYEFNLHGDVITVDTTQLDYDSIWDQLKLNKKEKEEANRVIELYHSSNFFDGVLIITSHSLMKSYNREVQRHQSDYYKTRKELERAAQDNKLVRKLIHHRILNLHPKWEPHLITRREDEGGVAIGPGHNRHIHAPYRLGIQKLAELEGVFEEYL